MYNVVAASRLRSKFKLPDPADTEELQEENKNKYHKRIIFWKFIKTAQYVIAFFILAAFFIIQCLQLVEKFHSKPTYMENSVLNQIDTEMPEFTFCPKDSGYKEDVLAKHGIKRALDYYGNYNHSWQSLDPSVTPQELFLQSTYSLTDLIKKIRVRTTRGEKRNDSEDSSFVFYPELNLKYEDDIYNFREQKHRRMGRCYSAYPGPKINSKLGGALGIYYIKIELLESVKVYFHHREQYLDMNGRMGIKLKKGEQIQLQANWALFEMLEEDTLMGYNCRKDPPYDRCMYKSVTTMMKEEANCTVPWVPDNRNICKNPKDRDLSYWKHYNSITNQEYTCPNPCNFLKVNIGSKNRKALTKNRTELFIYFQNRILASQESLLVTTLELAAEIGGYLGLFLGLSFFTFADMISTVINRRIRNLKKIGGPKLSPEEMIRRKIEEVKSELTTELINSY